VRRLLVLGWVLGVVGYYGPWIAHKTAALAVSGTDMGEFVKFLPGVVSGTVPVVRQCFYLPPVAIVVGVALLGRSKRLEYPWPLQVAMWVLSIPVSLQLLPPAWSPNSLMTAEFRLQVVALGICWLVLATAWFMQCAPTQLTGVLASLLALAAAVLSTWQLMLCKPVIDEVYGVTPSLGWGFFLCNAGLAVLTLGGLILLGRTREQGR